VTDAPRAALEAALTATHDVERELDGGGMSRVFVARERALGRQVVIKMLDEVGRSVDAARFRHEILLSAGLQHPHIVPVHSAGEAGGNPYFVMPFVEGVSLRSRLREGALGSGEATRVLRDVASAMFHAHARGIVHRDLKPENVMLSGGSAVVLDFGVAKALAAGTTRESPGDAAHNFTGAGFAVGTPRYMAPEQAAGDPALDYRADIYSFGILAFELFTGRPPFDGSPAEVLRKQITEEPPDISEACPGLPSTLVALVHACLAKDPAARPRDSAVVLDALDGVSTPLMGTRTMAVRRAEKRDMRWLEVMSVPASYVVVALAALAWLFHLSDTERIRDGVLAAGIIGSLLGFPLSIAGGLLLRIVSRDRAA
jgi:serine/threonine-protein kinase